MLNSIILMGRLTKNPESKKVNDTTITTFDIAVDNVRKESDGSRGTSFFTIKGFGKLAESVDQHVSKGSKVAVLGTIQQRNFVRKDGTKGTAYEVIADSVEFLEPASITMGEVSKGEKNIDEVETKNEDATPEAKFDPYTGKPLNNKEKK